MLPFAVTASTRSTEVRASLQSSTLKGRSSRAAASGPEPGQPGSPSSRSLSDPSRYGAPRTDAAAGPGARRPRLLGIGRAVIEREEGGLYGSKRGSHVPATVLYCGISA